MKEWVSSGALGTVGAVFLSLFHFLYGEGPARYLAITLYFLLIGMDWLAGYRASKIDGSYASEYGIDGGFRTAFIILMPAIGHLADSIMGTPGVAFGFLTAAFGLHIWKSMTANVIRAGWEKWVPGWAMNAVSEEFEHKVSRAMKRRLEKEKYLDEKQLEGEQK